MKALFLTQSSSLRLFFEVSQILRQNDGDEMGFYIADRQYFEEFAKNNPSIVSGGYKLLKEWEIINDSAGVTADIENLRREEKRLGDPVLWNALVADRRIYLGDKATAEQDYSTRYGHERMLSILDLGVRRMAQLFDALKPDMVVNFICVTVGEYLAYLEAKARGIPFLNLRPTRIENYFYAGESVLEPSAQLETAYKKARTGKFMGEDAKKARLYLTKVRESHAMYEGVIPADKKAQREISTKRGPSKPDVATKIRNLVRNSFFRWVGGSTDNHYRGVFYPYYFAKFKKPLRQKLIHFKLGPHYIDVNKLNSTDYAFFPLHKEPEVTLLAYGRPYLNQIEVARNIARSLPVGMKLLIKEHPSCIGYRSVSYYEKLLAIPNVVLISPNVGSRDVVLKARLVAIIGGSIGVEALMLKKPVIHFGRVPFGMLPDTMIRYVPKLDDLAQDIDNLLANHHHDEDALVAYIASVMKLSVPVDFYTVLLGRKGGYRKASDDPKNSRDAQMRRLAGYLRECLTRFQTAEETESRGLKRSSLIQ